MEGSEDTELVLYICIGGVAPGVPPVLLIVTMAAVVFSLSPGLSGLIIEIDILFIIQNRLHYRPKKLSLGSFQDINKCGILF